MHVKVYAQIDGEQIMKINEQLIKNKVKTGAQINEKTWKTGAEIRWKIYG